MPRSRGDKEYILPVNGLNTEANLLHFPQEYSSDLVNMEVDYNPQMVRPRKGLVESNNEILASTRNASDHDVAIQSYLWEGVNSNPELDWLVVQVAEFLYFFDTDGLANPTTAMHSERYDLTDALSGTVKGTAALLEPTRVVMTNVKGNLVVTSEQIDPVIIQFDGTDITGTALTLKIRDTLGIEDGLEIDEHPSTLVDEHKYNLYNQGWYKQRRLAAGKIESDPIAEYQTQWTNEYPSNSDIVWLGMVDSSGDLIFDAEWLRDQTFGSTPAARGHYVVNAFSIDRAAILVDPTGSGMTSGGSSGTGGAGTPIGGGVSTPTVPVE